MICYAQPYKPVSKELPGGAGFETAWQLSEHCWHPWSDGRIVCCFCGSPDNRQHGGFLPPAPGATP